MKVYKNILETIGKTPIVACTAIQQEYQLSSSIYAKVEAFNPSGSIKDRAAKSMIENAIAQGKIDKDTLIIEPTSGNTGIALASIAARLQLRLIIVMPSSMSIERRNLIKAYGAEIVLSDGAQGMKGAIAMAEQLAKDNPNSFIPSQFANEANPKIHYLTTGPEIYEQMDGKIDYLVCGVGTGGTISGTGRYLKEKDPNIKVIAVEPAGSPVLSLNKAGSHKIQGIGAGFVPKTLDRSIIDKIICVDDEQAFATARLLAQREGILAGISSGAAMMAAIKIAQEVERANIVVILPDTGERYLSTPLFNGE